ncbi:MAG TPA: serine/threonine-protein kinase [Acidobacteriota bacterium]|nr:serine/threonine-protein kinase [Acidobacteriota bacterium]HRV08778.1 serine/threonine-protein kinase [Acidobacteriota bacterium]
MGFHHSLARVALVTPGGFGTLVQRQSLLRSRLRSAFAVLAFGSVLLGLRELIGWMVGVQDGSLYRGQVLWAHVGVLLLLLGLLLLLRSERSLSWRQLRAIEIVGFAFAALLIGFTHYHQVMGEVQSGDPGMALAVVRTVFFAYFLLMVVYGLFVPHDWKTAAWVVIPLGLLAPAVNLFVYQMNREFAQACGELWTYEHLSTSVLLLVLGIVTVIYGSHVMYSLRREATAARQLGQYNLVERIGSGGMGEVWRAEHQMLVRPAAIKLIRPEALQGPEETVAAVVSRFEREARAMAGLRSPHTVQVYDFGVTEDGTLYYVMELLDGLDLETVVERFGPMPAERVIFLLSQACESLAEAHLQGLVHRDVKPANLYTCRYALHYDFVKVLDFGLVKHVGSSQDTRLTLAGSVTGTPAFMAPEVVLDASRADPRSDVYSLGCVAYLLLVGKPVFEEGPAMQVILKHLQEPPLPISQRAELEVPAELERLIMHCLEKKPEDRPQNAEEVLQALSAVTLPNPWTQERARQWWERHFPRPSIRETVGAP